MGIGTLQHARFAPDRDERGARWYGDDPPGSVGTHAFVSHVADVPTQMTEGMTANSPFMTIG
jgi:hypothetical protein